MRKVTRAEVKKLLLKKPFFFLKRLGQNSVLTIFHLYDDCRQSESGPHHDMMTVLTVLCWWWDFWWRHRLCYHNYMLTILLKEFDSKGRKLIHMMGFLDYRYSICLESEPASYTENPGLTLQVRILLNNNTRPWCVSRPPASLGWEWGWSCINFLLVFTYA